MTYLKSYKCGAIIIAIAAGSVSLAPMVFAQGTEPAAQPADEAKTLNTVIVTARKRAEDLQDVPISISAYSGETLNERGLDDVGSLTNFTPNLEINSGRPDGGGTAAQIYIRGVGQNDFLIPNDPGVGLYVDDVYVSRSSGALVGLTDVASVEILRGPQGTLYGKNTIGGAVRVNSKTPEFDVFEGSSSFTVGSYNRLDFRANANIPINDKLAVRIAGASRNADDIGERPLDPTGSGTGNVNEDALRLIARYQPASDWDITVSADYTRTDQNGPYGTNLGYIAGASALIDVLNAEVYPALGASLGLPPGSVFDETWVGRADLSYGTGWNFDKYDTWGVSAIVEHDFNDNLSLKSITAYRQVEGAAGRDGDHSPFPVLETISDDDNSQFSQEIQLNGSAFDDRLQFTTGVYYLKEDANNQVVSNLWGGLLQSSLALDFNARSMSTLEGESIAVFAQGTFDITDNVHWTVGGRYNQEKKEFATTWAFIDRTFTCPGLDVNGELEDCNETWDVFTPMTSLSVDLTDDFMVYGSYTEGFKAGGWTPRLFSQTSLKQFDPEELAAYELGFKSTWMDRRLVLNANVFFSEYEDLQLTSVLADAQGSPQPVVENAGQAEIFGIEIEGAYRPTDTTTFEFGLGYLDGEYIELDPGVSFPLSNELPDTPPLTINASFQQDFPLQNGALLSARLDTGYKDDTQKDPANSPTIQQDAYTLVNSRVSYVSSNGNWELALFGTNLTDETYITNALDLAATFGFLEVYFGRPREIGVELKVNF